MNDATSSREIVRAALKVAAPRTRKSRASCSRGSRPSRRARSPAPARPAAKVPMIVAYAPCGAGVRVAMPVPCDRRGRPENIDAYQPTGDQPKAIEALTEGILGG